MGQKINPHGLRVGVIKGWDSRWFAKDGLVGDLLVEDYKIREFLKKKLYQAGVPSIEIERKGDKVHHHPLLKPEAVCRQSQRCGQRRHAL